jgi:hypothetical protein
LIYSYIFSKTERQRLNRQRIDFDRFSLLVVFGKMNKGIKVRFIDEQFEERTIKQAAIASGMRTLREDGIKKVIAGMTTLKLRATRCPVCSPSYRLLLEPQAR